MHGQFLSVAIRGRRLERWQWRPHCHKPLPTCLGHRNHCLRRRHSVRGSVSRTPRRSPKANAVLGPSEDEPNSSRHFTVSRRRRPGTPARLRNPSAPAPPLRPSLGALATSPRRGRRCLSADLGGTRAWTARSCPVPDAATALAHSAKRPVGRGRYRLVPHPLVDRPPGPVDAYGTGRIHRPARRQLVSESRLPTVSPAPPPKVR